MAIKNSVNVTNILTNPITPTHKKLGEKKVQIDQVALAATDIDNTNDQVMMCPIPTNAVITSIKLLSDDLDSNGTPTLAWDVGLYYTGIGTGQKNRTSGDLVDVDCFATAITVGQAASSDVTNVGKVGYEVRFEAADIITISQEAWEVAGLTSDPGGLFYIGLDITTAAATGAAGDLVMIVEYLI